MRRGWRVAVYTAPFPYSDTVCVIATRVCRGRERHALGRHHQFERAVALAAIECDAAEAAYA